jgi:hypothetical protein
MSNKSILLVALLLLTHYPKNVSAICPASILAALKQGTVVCPGSTVGRGTLLSEQDQKLCCHQHLAGLKALVNLCTTQPSMSGVIHSSCIDAPPVHIPTPVPALIPPIVDLRGGTHDAGYTKILEDMERYKSECPPSQSVLAFDLDDTVLKTPRGSGATAKALGKQPSSSMFLKEVQKRGYATLAISARNVVSLDTGGLDWVRHGGLQTPQDRFDLLNPNALIEHTQDDLNNADLHPKTSATIFNHSASFFNERGKPSAEGLFTLQPQTDADNQALLQTTKPDDLKKFLLYKGGVVLTSHQSKGAALKRFLEITSTTETIKCIFFADDLNETNPAIGSTANHDDMAAAFQTAAGKQVFRYQFPAAPAIF